MINAFIMLLLILLIKCLKALNKQRGDIGRQRQTSRSYSPSTLGGSTIPQSPIDDEV